MTGILSSASSCLQYTLPRMKQATNELREEVPLFIQYVLKYTLPRMKQATYEVSLDLPLFV